ncbi:MAG: hypothetical protein ACF8CQ_11595 [Rhodopirellula sp. JB044]|uniref:hypothetical protein n=1 Tax=Rhodopirellula sp. JB044 TaxID=3342844 RepID=UPI00370AEEA2
MSSLAGGCVLTRLYRTRMHSQGLLYLQRHVDGAAGEIRGTRLLDPAADLSRSLLSIKVERTEQMWRL